MSLLYQTFYTLLYLSLVPMLPKQHILVANGFLLIKARPVVKENLKEEGIDYRHSVMWPSIRLSEFCYAMLFISIGQSRSWTYRMVFFMESYMRKLILHNLLVLFIPPNQIMLVRYHKAPNALNRFQEPCFQNFLPFFSLKGSSLHIMTFPSSFIRLQLPS